MPRVYPDPTEAAERFLSGKMTPAQRVKFRAFLSKDRKLRELVREVRVARKAMKIYSMVLPPAAEFKAIRKAVLAEI